MVPRKAGLALVISISLLLLFAYRSPEITAAVQRGFVLDLESPCFSFGEYAFNDTNTSQEYDYSSGNVTYWVGMPRNSTVLSAEMNVTGKITTIYTNQTATSGLQGFSIGNCTPDSANEISTGTQATNGIARLLYGSNGSLIWQSQVSVNKQIYSTCIGNVTSEDGGEVAVGSADTYVYLLNSSGGQIWNYSTGGEVRAVVIGDVYDGEAFVAAGAGSTIYLINSSGGLNWSTSVGNTVYDISIGNVTTDPGNEIVAACASGNLYVLNSSGSEVNNPTIGTAALNSVSVGNVTAEPGNEIAAGSADNRAYLLNSSGGQIWNFTTQGSINSVRIGDATTEYAGNEIVCGSNDKKVYTLDSAGNLIWDFEAEDYINTIAVGNITADDGNEVAAGAANGYIYTFNFDYFPANLSIDVGANGTYDWSYSGALRDTQKATGLEGAFQYHLDSCGGGICNVSVLFHSDGPGKLNISGLNVSYSYNISNIVNYTLASEWSRTSNVQVNESIGNEVKNVSFLTNPEQDVEVAYIKIPGSAGECDFNGSACQNVTVGSVNACDVPNFTIGESGTLPQAFYFWDDTMGSGVPVKGNESGYSYTKETDSFLSMKSITIWNDTPTVFYNITANTTVDDPSVDGMLFLNVSWLGQDCNITPQQDDASCDSGSPAYASFDCSTDTFHVCKKGAFFRWVQPCSNSSVTYQAGGATNLPPNVSDPNVTLNVSPWGDWFNYSILVNDTDGDNASVRLWYFLTKDNEEFSGGTVNISGNGTAWFNITSNKDWVGVNYYWFQYQDFNSSGWPMHSAVNTSDIWGPLARRHNTEVIHVWGNESAVNRSDSVELVVRINDTENGTWIQNGTQCVLWVTYNNSNLDEGHFNTTNSSGYCVFWFTPDGNYSTGNQTWKAGVLDDTYYDDSNSSDFVLTINGRVNVSLTVPEEGGILYRNSSSILEARLVDQFGFGVNQSGFNCSFWFNNAYLNSSNTTAEGRCNISWHPQCGYSRGGYVVNVSLSDPTESYLILDDMDWRNVSLNDELNITILEPQEYSLFHRGDSVDFNSSVNDSCGLCVPGNYSVNWSLKWKRRLEVTVNKSPGYEGQVFPVVINASYLESRNIDLGDWPINYTRVLLKGVEIPSRVNAWNDSNKTGINWSQAYFNSYSELVFLAEQASWENLTYEVAYNRSDGQEDFSYLENSGFESGGVLPWKCFSSNCTGQYCQCELRQEGGEVNGSRSLYLSSEDTGSGYPSVQGASIYAGRPLGQDRLRIRHKPTGQFVNDAYIRLYAGQGMCELSTATGVWHEDTCYNTSFSSALWVNITVHDNGSGGGESDAAHVYIDYVCLANSSGDCVNYHSGYPHSVSGLSETPIGYPDNMTWQMPVNESVGLRRVAANASGSYYEHEVENLYVYVYGWSNLSAGNISSTNCTYNETWICRKNASMDVFCFVRDANTSEWVEGHNVSFWGDGSYIGSNATDSAGMSLFNWVNSSDSEGNYTIVCNITDDPYAFYNVTGNNSAELYFNISSGNTTAEVEVNLAPSTPAENLTRIFNRTYYLEINITNTGQAESMYDVVVEISTTTGIHAEPVGCPAILPTQGCDRTSAINVTYLATEGYKDIYVNVTWLNSDASQGNASNATGLDVVNNTVLNVVETEVNYTVPRGGSAQAGSFTVESFGNTDLLSVNLSLSGGNASEIGQWNLSYSPEPPIGLIPHNGEQLVNISLDVPDNATEGLYTASIFANSTGSSCSPASLCWDYLVFNLNVTMPDWGVSENQLNKTIGLNPDPLNGTIGIVQVTNNKDANWTFNASVEGNGTGKITLSAGEFNLTPLSAFSLEVYHNSTGEYVSGLYVANVTIANNENAVPQSINVSVSLKVINLSISIVSPNQSNPVSDIVPEEDVLNITANATLSGIPLDENITWSVMVGGVACGNVKSAYNLSDQLWYINCSAPYLPGNPINNSLNLTGCYETEGACLPDVEDDAVIYRDTTPPQIGSIWVAGADSEGNVENATKSEIVIRASITDNTVINASWAMLYYQDSHYKNYSLYEESGYWTFNFSPINAGDYRVIVHANDSAGNENDTASMVMGYFDVYLPINLNGTLVDKEGTPIEANFTLYKNDTLWEVHSFSTNGSGGYSWVLHRRFYDIRVGFLGHELFFSDVDINASAASQWGADDPDNLTSPITLDAFTRSTADIYNVNLPSGAVNKILVLGMESNLNKSNSSIYVSLDYAQALQDATGLDLTEGDFGIYRCPNWSISSRTCIGGDFLNASIAASVDEASNRISFITTETSAYAVAEWEGVSENGDGNGNVNGNGGDGSRGGGGTSAVTTTTLPFTVTTSIGSIRIHPGENKTYLFSVRNKASSNITVSLDVQGLEDFIFPEKSLLEIAYNESEAIEIVVSVPDTMGTGSYTGSILVTAAGKTQEIPITMTVSIEAKDLVSLSIDVLTPNVNPGSKLRFGVELKNLGLPPGFNVSLVYTIKESERERLVSEMEEVVFLEDTLLFSKSVDIGGANPIGQYYLEVWAYFGDGKSVNELVVFNLVEPYWSSWEGRIILLILSLAGMGIMGYYGWMRYREWKLEKSRYIFPLNYSKIPREGEGSFWIGRIADTDKGAWFKPGDLTTHVIVAGATGAGKSVGASVFVEEALDRNIPVIVFDPTAQWTGFVKALEDQNLLKYYSAFGMNPKGVRPYKGMIFEVTSPQELIFEIRPGFKKYLNPGEITIFALDKLKPGQYDEAVGMIIDALFSMPWEESTSLKMLVVFDEVHRLLEKYGGRGGYVALERAAREFRKWGIGMIMCSQVLADFKEAIAGNVLTEVQLNTKSITDIQKVETKYGKEYAGKISRQGVGTGMLQNPKYNDGKPYFVQFRPTWHNPHKISNKEMDLYREFAKRLKSVEERIEQRKKAGRDTFDLELELKLAKDKLKQGRFRMAQIYITSLEQHLGKG
jgi:hypothetical protein